MFKLIKYKKIQYLIKYQAAKSKPLTHQQAKLRFDQFTRDPIQYTFHMKLLKGQNYQGLAESYFKLQHTKSDLRVDFTGQKVNKLFVNEKHVNQIQYDGNSITIPQKLLKQGANSLAVNYNNTYNNDGNGCVSFIDVDEKQYLYTQFEPYHANKVFPLFDQPDLKAQMKLNILSPPEWKVLSNQQPLERNENFNINKYLRQNVSPSFIQKQIREFTSGFSGNMWMHPASKILPTYLFCFIVGQYYELKCPNPYKNLPMSLYCIESLSQHMQKLAPFMWQVTIQSMKFFEQYFGFPFSFNKYQQVFAHEYKWGAMQNAGIVTFNDLYVFKQKVSTDRMLSLANTVSHELAHHWFGNLVTMKWWDNLWLNQSFADYISHYCLQKIKDKLTTIKYESSMAPFNTRKSWGYHDDQLVTTHPIFGPVANAQIAETIFDGITYSKGAATMKQLQFLMNQDNFSKALSEYFHKFQWGNTILNDFIDCMQHHFHNKDFTLQQWKAVWLQKACHNKIQPIWDCTCKQKHAKLDIIQSPVLQDHPTLRMHAIKTGFYKNDLSEDVKDTILLPVTKTSLEYDGTQNYQAILLNYGDYSFVKSVLDKKSASFFSQNLYKIKDILSRSLIWRAFYDMVKDAKVTSSKYIQFFLNNIQKQQDDGLFQMQFDLVNASINTYTPRVGRDQLNDKVFYFIQQLLLRVNTSQQNRIVVLKTKLVSFAQTPSTKKILIDWRNNKIQNLKSYPQTIGHQWNTIIRAFTLSDLTAQQKWRLYDEQFKLDSSDTAKNHRKTCEALLSTPDQYESLYQSYKLDSNVSLKQKIHSMSGWNSHYHQSRLKLYRDRFFKDLSQVATLVSYDNAILFLHNAEPNLDDIEITLNMFQKILPDLQKVDYMHLQGRKSIDNLKIRNKTYKLWYSQNKSK